MRRGIVGGVIAAGLIAPPAHACTPLPARSGKYVQVSVLRVHHDTDRTAVRVCVRGRRIELARGTQRDGRRDGVRIGAASAAGHRVAWIEARRRHGIRTVVVTLAAVGRRVRVLKRFPVQRAHTIFQSEMGVVVTREGDLAWAAGTYGGRTGVVAVKRPGKRTLVLSKYPG